MSRLQGRDCNHMGNGREEDDGRFPPCTATHTRRDMENIATHLAAGGHRVVGEKWGVTDQALVQNDTQGPPIRLVTHPQQHVKHALIRGTHKGEHPANTNHDPRAR
jgi:hypothetical protein